MVMASISTILVICPQLESCSLNLFAVKQSVIALSYQTALFLINQILLSTICTMLVAVSSDFPSKVNVDCSDYHHLELDTKN